VIWQYRCSPSPFPHQQDGWWSLSLSLSFFFVFNASVRRFCQKSVYLYILHAIKLQAYLTRKLYLFVVFGKMSVRFIAIFGPEIPLRHLYVCTYAYIAATHLDVHSSVSVCRDLVNKMFSCRLHRRHQIWPNYNV
jgi:hypothetical protein